MPQDLAAHLVLASPASGSKTTKSPSASTARRSSRRTIPACSEKVGQPCFTLHNTCIPGRPFGDRPMMLMAEADSHKKYDFRVGDGPVVIEGDFVKAKTLLFPGMRGTPEEMLLARAALPRPEKERMVKAAEKLSYRHVAETGDYGLIRWFHERGVPQVVSLDPEVFRFE